MGGYRISQLAAMTGVPASTLRFHEQVGLLPASRTPGGYREYDDADVERVRFIAAAKRLALPLEQIRDLLAVWDGGVCRDVSASLAPLLTERITAVDARVAELIALRARLVRLRGGLPDSDQPCGTDCLAEAPVACSLPGADRDARMARWRAVIMTGGGSAVLVSAARLCEVAELIGLEQRCCPFLDFTMRVVPDGVEVVVSGPASSLFFG